MPTQLLFGVDSLEQKSLTCFPDRLDVVGLMIILFTAIIAYVIDGLGTRLDA